VQGHARIARAAPGSVVEEAGGAPLAREPLEGGLAVAGDAVGGLHADPVHAAGVRGAAGDGLAGEVDALGPRGAHALERVAGVLTHERVGAAFGAAVGRGVEARVIEAGIAEVGVDRHHGALAGAAGQGEEEGNREKAGEGLHRDLEGRDGGPASPSCVGRAQKIPCRASILGRPRPARGDGERGPRPRGRWMTRRGAAEFPGAQPPSARRWIRCSVRVPARPRASPSPGSVPRCG
jgi:hypothetical protein